MYLRDFLTAAQNFSSSFQTAQNANPFQSSSDSGPVELGINFHYLFKFQLGFMELPKIDITSLEFLLKQDEICTNQPNKLFINKFDNLGICPFEFIILEVPGNKTSTRKYTETPLQFNKNLKWVELVKLLSETIEEKQEVFQDESDCDFNFEKFKRIKIEDIQELDFFDERNALLKRKLYFEKNRFVYANESIYLKFKATNPLGVKEA